MTPSWREAGTGSVCLSVPYLHFHILLELLQETAYNKSNLTGRNTWTAIVPSIHINLPACVLRNLYVHIRSSMHSEGVTVALLFLVFNAIRKEPCRTFCPCLHVFIAHFHPLVSLLQVHLPRWSVSLCVCVRVCAFCLSELPPVWECSMCVCLWESTWACVCGSRC